jgi:hypothetical protein
MDERGEACYLEGVHYHAVYVDEAGDETESCVTRRKGERLMKFLRGDDEWVGHSQ